MIAQGFGEGMTAFKPVVPTDGSGCRDEVEHQRPRQCQLGLRGRLTSRTSGRRS